MQNLKKMFKKAKLKKETAKNNTMKKCQTGTLFSRSFFLRSVSESPWKVKLERNSNYKKSLLNK